MAVLESGDIYFLFRPRVNIDEPRGLRDVQRFFVILRPRERRLYRRIVVGRKRMPDLRTRERLWGRVDRIGTRPEEILRELGDETYDTKTLGERHQPAARPAGEGVYAIVAHDAHAHLAYALELPAVSGAPQDALGIERRASYIVAVFNPERRGPGAVSTRRSTYPPDVQSRFEDRRFAPVTPELLDYEGTELVLVGAGDTSELEIALEPENEDQTSADIFRDLELDRTKHPTRALLEGAWDR